MSFDVKFCKSLDPAQVLDYIANFDINLLTPNEILTIIEQVSAYDLMAVFGMLRNFVPYVEQVIRRMCTIDAFEYMLILSADPMYDLNIGEQIFSRARYWLNVFSGLPETKRYFEQLYVVFRNQDDGSCLEFFSKCEYPSNRLIEFMARKPDYNNFFHLLTPEEKCRFCTQDKIKKYYSDSLSLPTRISALLRAGDIDKLLATKLNTSMEYVINKCQSCDIDQLPVIAREMIPPVLNELTIVPDNVLLERFEKKPAPTLHDVEIVVKRSKTYASISQMLNLFATSPMGEDVFTFLKNKFPEFVHPKRSNKRQKLSN